MRHISFFLVIFLLFAFQGVLIEDTAYECSLTMTWESDRAVESVEIYVPVPRDTGSQVVEITEVSPRPIKKGEYYTFTFENTSSVTIEMNFKIQTYTVVQEIDSSGNMAVEERSERIDYRDPAVVAKAKELTQGCDTDRERVEEIFQFVEAMEYKYNGEEHTASWMLSHGKGDCTEFTYLFIALCEAVGIEARPVWGWLPTESSTVSHLWAEVYLGRWYTVDPTEGNFHVIEPHITMNKGMIEARGEHSVDLFAYCTFRGDTPRTAITTEFHTKEIPYWEEKDASYLEFSCEGTACMEALEANVFPRIFPSSLRFLIFTLPFFVVYAVTKWVESI